MNEVELMNHRKDSQMSFTDPAKEAKMTAEERAEKIYRIACYGFADNQLRGDAHQIVRDIAVQIREAESQARDEVLEAAAKVVRDEMEAWDVGSELYTLNDHTLRRSMKLAFQACLGQLKDRIAKGRKA